MSTGLGEGGGGGALGGAWGVLRTVPVRILVFTFLWWVLVEGELRYAWLAGGLIALAVAVSYLLWPVGSWRWKPLRLLPFLLYFGRSSVQGGVDIARRAFSPSLPLESFLLRFHLRLDDEAAKAFLAWTIGLVPGTASVRLQDGILFVHVIGDPPEVEERLQEVEERVARLFGAELGPPGEFGSGKPGSVSDIRTTEPQSEEGE